MIPPTRSLYGRSRGGVASGWEKCMHGGIALLAQID
eukprot:CAMPEP_0113262710 /NCGR_PEP_ID=MMETSP0008_2-20120614/18068_1 /TAXON_ID=97485 /ORGANISM="Prymnesium parvum" /LENGTH=35 /DNA_ID=CAMNT_0000111389 /DNA_START=608 /DNA_END=712 /DNA_ORIENTATION=- /assembly_acc=CAM_ASM_000153